MPTFKDLKDLFENYVINKYHELSALAVVLFISFVFLLSVHIAIKDDFNYEWYFYGLIFFVIISSWIIHRYRPFPKNRKDPKTKNQKTGIVIAIFSENYEGVKIKGNFIKELKRNICDAGLDRYFNIVLLLNHQSENIKSNKDVEKLHNEVGGHIYFYGDIQKEHDGKDKKYFLNIDGYVKHLPIPLPVSQDISFDFRAVLPKEINFNEFFALRGCKATAKIVYLTTRYIVGLASFLSGNPFLAFEMHKNLSDELNEYKNINNDENLQNLAKFDFKHLKAIRNKLPIIISNECYVISRAYFINGKFDKMFEYFTLSLKNNEQNYSAYLLKSIYDFKINEDPSAALESIKKAKKYAGSKFEWRYSYAFLKFWSGDYEEAFRTCKKIEKQYYLLEPISIDEVEKFNLDLLENNKGKPQLYFWIGYLNYKKKLNFPNALKYFESFVKIADKESMNILIQKSNSYIVEIKNLMKSKK